MIRDREGRDAYEYPYCKDKYLDNRAEAKQSGTKWWRSWFFGDDGDGEDDDEEENGIEMAEEFGLGDKGPKKIVREAVV